eukprot:scaffold165113_cov32-Prasinocladus_malaysianus.AAC.1
MVAGEYLRAICGISYGEHVWAAVDVVDIHAMARNSTGLLTIQLIRCPLYYILIMAVAVSLLFSVPE